MKKPLGDILLDMGALDQLRLRAALAYQRQWGLPLGRVLVDNRLCGEREVLTGLARQTGLPWVELDQETPDAEVVSCVTRKVAEQHRLIPLRVDGRRGEVLVVAAAAPASLPALDAARAVSRKQRVVAFVASDDC